MNRIIIGAGILLGLIFTSCKDYLSTSSDSQMLPEYVFNSEDDIFVAISGIYSVFTQDALYNSRFIKTYTPSTDAEFWAAGPTSVGFTNYTQLASNNDLLNTWQFFYQAINRANLVIDGIREYELWQNADTTVVSNLTQLMGEARTLRAMMYLDMTRFWGDVPFRTWGSRAEEDYYMSATPRHEIWEWLLDDLMEIEPVMRYASEISNGVERAAREFCQGLIGLIAMNRGGWYLRPWDGTEPSGVVGDPNVGYMYRHDDYLKYMEIARDYTQKVIESNTHSLSQSYAKLWYEVTNDRYAVGDDIIFSIPLSGGEYCVWAGIPVEKGTHPYGGAGEGMASSMLYFISFDTLDMRRDVTCVPYKYNARLNQEPNIKTLGSMQNGKWNRIAIENPLGAESSKNSGINYVFMRYADVLTLFAEAENELNGPTDAAKEALKTVRRRAFDTRYWNEKVDEYVDRLNTKEEFFQAIMDERKWEFGGEQQRKYDLARWNRYGQALSEIYFEYIGWAKSEAGLEGYGQYVDRIRRSVWWRPVDDPNNPGRTLVEFWGLNKQEYNAPADTYEEWTEIKIVDRWYRPDNAPGKELNDNLQGSFYGYINPSNEDSVDPTIHPVRYLMPYPSTVIDEHRGALKNYYGY